jgi:ferritin-like metal-binding protein YciE
MVAAQVKELLLQSLTHERGGVLVYQTALECAVNTDLRREWDKYLQQTRNHVAVLTRVCESLGLEAGEMTPGCQIVQHTGRSLVVAMKMALAEGDPVAAELVACESVLLAETKDHADWELIGECAKELKDDAAVMLQAAYEEIEEEEDEHLYHTQGWCRELWLNSLGLKAVLPPPEEKRDVKSASAAEAAKKSR